MSSKREQSVLDGRTKLWVIFLLCMTVLVESVIKQRAKCTRWKDKIIGYISLVHDCIGGKCHQTEGSVLDGRTKLLVILLLCMTVLVESVIKQRAKCTRWQDKIIGYITLVHDCIGGKCHQGESKVY